MFPLNSLSVFFKQEKRKCSSVAFEYKIQIFNAHLGQHEAYYKSKRAQTIQDPSGRNSFVFLQNELLKIEESFKVGLEPDLFLCYLFNSLPPSFPRPMLLLSLQRVTYGLYSVGRTVLANTPFGFLNVLRSSFPFLTPPL